MAYQVIQYHGQLIAVTATGDGEIFLRAKNDDPNILVFYKNVENEFRKANKIPEAEAISSLSEVSLEILGHLSSIQVRELGFSEEFIAFYDDWYNYGDRELFQLKVGGLDKILI